jgi:hypothetical protein
MVTWSRLGAAAVAALTFCGANAARAADMASEEAAAVYDEPLPGWSFTVAPYFWMAGLSGDIAEFGAPPVSVDVKFADILKALDFSMMVVSEARYGRFSLSSDLLYLKLSTDKTTPKTPFAGSLGLGAKTLEATALAGYSLIDTPRGRLDVVAGARLWSVETTLSVNGGVLSGLWLRDRETWVDAMAGLKGRVDLTPNFYLTGWALAGGGSSESSWDVLGGVGYRFSDRFSAVLGYRAAGVDYENGPFLFDVVLQGPILGAVLRF